MTAAPYILSQPYLDANFAYLVAGRGIVTGAVSTTNATPSTVATIAVSTNTTMVLTVLVAARRTGGAAGAVGDGAGYFLGAVVKNIAGTVTIISQSLIFTGEDQGAWNVDLAVSSTNVIVRVTGAANNNIDWSASGQTLAVA